jgi:prepilin-type N-terminal cleavage/methylation domain-containing protein
VHVNRRDQGFTLIELLIAVVILGVVILALGNAVISVVHNSTATSDRLALSHDAQISAAYFARDVAAVGVRDYTVSGVPFKTSIQLNAAYNAGGQTCGDATIPVALVRFLSDDWDPATAAVSTDIVGYYVSGTDLYRLRCAGSSTPAFDAAIAHDLTGTPTVACSSTCDAAALPQQVTLTFTVTRAAADPYPITLTGQRRQS